MSNINIVSLQIANEAFRLEREGQYEAAVERYNRSIEILLPAIKAEMFKRKMPGIPTNDELLFTQRAREYMEIVHHINVAHLNKEPIFISPAEVVVTGEEEKSEEKLAEPSVALEDPADETLRAIILGSIMSSDSMRAVTWDDVAGNDDVKDQLKASTVLPNMFPSVFASANGYEVLNAVLMYGPPGTGKTELARALAYASNATFFAISSTDIVRKWMGESQQLVKLLFKVAREKAPSIIFIDEIDALLRQRRDTDHESTAQVKSEFLVQMDGVGVGKADDVLVLGATNAPWDIDPAFLRRFKDKVHIGMPDDNSRVQLFKIRTKNAEHMLGEEEFAMLSMMTQGFSGADISKLVNAAMKRSRRLAQLATHFLKRQDGKYVAGTPCSDCQYTPDGLECTRCGLIETSLIKLPHDSLVVPPLSFDDFEHALKTTVPDNSQELVEKFIKYSQNKNHARA